MQVHDKHGLITGVQIVPRAQYAGDSNMMWWWQEVLGRADNLLKGWLSNTKWADKE